MGSTVGDRERAFAIVVVLLTLALIAGLVPVVIFLAAVDTNALSSFPITTKASSSSLFGRRKTGEDNSNNNNNKERGKRKKKRVVVEVVDDQIDANVIENDKEG